MDTCTQVYWTKDKAALVGAIITCREVDLTKETWDGTQYVPNSPIGATNLIVLYITAVPVTEIECVKYVLEQVGSDGVAKREFNLNQDNVTAEEQAQVLTYRYITVTWTRFKELVQNLQSVALTDDDLLC